MAQTPQILPLSDLLAGCLRQHRRSQEVLYRQFYGYAMGVCLRYTQTREEAVEVLNDGFLKVFTKLNQYDPMQPFKPWLRRILINTATDYYRQAVPHYYQKDLAAAEQEMSLEADGLSNLEYEYLLTLVKRLTPAYRIVFNLYAIDGYSHDEIATQLGISVGTSKSNLARARENLRQMLQKKTNDEYGRVAR
ncbi:RNA polymerase sigma factor [uncultured Fibrella sp.]|uniref:RNA polymerase sigma factor n=1 Tax=uncultured Fibrella sp. TaxID=1284596 RepID=UPI0035C9A3E8